MFNLETHVNVLYTMYKQPSPGAPPMNEFTGFKLSDLYTIDKIFHINIYVYELINDKDNPLSCHLIRRSMCKYPDTLHLNLYKTHFSYIHDLTMYTRSFKCKKCGKLFRRSFNLNRHEQTCEVEVKRIFPGGVFHVGQTVFQKMREFGIHVSEELRFYPFRATFDFECYFDNSDLPPNSPKVDWLARHEILSVSICSNVSGFSLPCCFINEGDPNQLVDRFMNYLNKISNAAYKMLTKVYEDVFDSLKNALETATANRSLNEDAICDVINKDNDSDNDNDAEEYDGAELSIITPEDIYKLIAPLKGFIKELPVIGFNSGKYDLNLIKKYIAPYLLTTDVDDNNDDDDDDENHKADRDRHVKNDMFVVMRNTNFMCLKTKTLTFLDIINYLAPGFSYDKFLKAYGCTLTKGFFPYEWVTSLSKLVC